MQVHLIISIFFIFLVIGCGAEINESYVPLSSNPHPFPSPADVTHDEWLRSHGFDIGQCTACHGTNFDGFGNQSMSCGKCHSENNRITVTDCNFCHGMKGIGINPLEPRNWAPPTDLNGNVSRNARGVGAHQVHLSSIPPSLPLPCSGCHQVPNRWDDTGHLDTGFAEVIGVGWNDSTLTCTGCHGPAGHIWTQSN
ncbi:MAG: hypothetical protein N2450_02700 [bacterium]|nr:hypothetical protein [bacterium]